MAVRKKFPAIIFLAGLLCFSFSLFSETPKNPPDFHTRLHEAAQNLLAGDEKKGAQLFEQLIQDNPAEFLIYDAYAKALIARNHLEEGSRIYETALQPVSAKSPQLAGMIQALTHQFKETVKFREQMKSALPWKDAKLIGTSHFAIRTNIPDVYYLAFAQRLESILQKEKEILEKILGKPVEEFPYAKIYVAGRTEDYQSLLEERKAQGDSHAGRMAKGYYSLADQSLVVFFDGYCDWRALAHEMVHFITRKSLIQNPSLLLDEGFAEYIAVKVEKENSAYELELKLKNLHWMSDQGSFQSLNEIFEIWEDYGIRGHQKEADHFYGYALSFIHYLLESGDPDARRFFMDWVEYEAKNKTNSLASTRSFFEERLSKESYRKIEDGWIRHLLNLTYEKL